MRNRTFLLELPQIMQTGGVAVGGLNLQQSQLAGRSLLNTQPTLNLRPVTTDPSFLNSARQTEAQAYALGERRRQFNSEQARLERNSRRDLIAKITTGINSQIKSDTDAASGLNTALYGDLIRERITQKNQIVQSALPKMVNGDVSAAQDLQFKLQNMNSSEKYLTASQNSQGLAQMRKNAETAMATISSNKGAKDNRIAFDHDAYNQTMEEYYGKIQADSEFNILSTGALQKNFLVNVGQGQKEFEDMVDSYGNMSARKDMAQILKANPDTAIYGSIIDDPSLTKEQYAGTINKVANRNSNISGYFDLDLGIDKSNQLPYILDKLGVVAPDDNVIKTIGKIAEQGNKATIDANAATDKAKVASDAATIKNQRDIAAENLKQANRLAVEEEKRKTKATEQSYSVSKDTSVSYTSDGKAVSNDGKVHEIKLEDIADLLGLDDKVYQPVAGQLKNAGINLGSKKMKNALADMLPNVKINSDTKLGVLSTEQLETLKKAAELDLSIDKPTIDLLNTNPVIKDMSSDEKLYLGTFLDNENIQDGFFDDYYEPNILQPTIDRLQSAATERGLTDNQLGYLIHHHGPSGAEHFLINGKASDDMLKLNPNADKDLVTSFDKIDESKSLRENILNIETSSKDPRTVYAGEAFSSAVGKFQFLGKTHYGAIKNYIDDNLPKGRPEEVAAQSDNITSYTEQFNNPELKQSTIVVSKTNGLGKVTKYVVTNNPELKAAQLGNNTLSNGNEVNKKNYEGLNGSKSEVFQGSRSIGDDPDEQYMTIPLDKFSRIQTDEPTPEPSVTTESTSGVVGGSGFQY